MKKLRASSSIAASAGLPPETRPGGVRVNVLKVGDSSAMEGPAPVDERIARDGGVGGSACGACAGAPAAAAPAAAARAHPVEPAHEVELLLLGEDLLRAARLRAMLQCVVDHVAVEARPLPLVLRKRCVMRERLARRLHLGVAPLDRGRLFRGELALLHCGGCLEVVRVRPAQPPPRGSAASPARRALV